MKQYWNIKSVIEISKKYKTRSEFSKEKSGAYHYALQHHLLDNMSWLICPKNYNSKWDDETVFEESKKYNSRSEFAVGCNGAYKYALKHKLLEEMVWLKPKTLIGNDAQKIDNVYAYEFEKYKIVYVGRTIDIKRRDKQHRKQQNNLNNKIKSPVYKFAKENNIEIPKIKILENNITILDGQKLEKEWLDKYINDGWKTLNVGKCGEGCGSLGVLNTINRKWFKENVIQESKKYFSKASFKRNCNGAYKYALKHKLLEEMVWLKRSKPHNKKWDKESVIEESKKYQTKAEFRKKSNGAYDYAKKHKILEEMVWFIPQRRKWDEESVIEESKKYNTRSELQKKNPSAYGFAYKHNLINKLYPKIKE